MSESTVDSSTRALKRAEHERTLLLAQLEEEAWKLLNWGLRKDGYDDVEHDGRVLRYGFARYWVLGRSEQLGGRKVYFVGRGECGYLLYRRYGVLVTVRWSLAPTNQLLRELIDLVRSN